MERVKIKERDELIPESVKEILFPAFKFGAFTGELWFRNYLSMPPFYPSINSVPFILNFFLIFSFFSVQNL